MKANKVMSPRVSKTFIWFWISGCRCWLTPFSCGKCGIRTFTVKQKWSFGLPFLPHHYITDRIHWCWSLLSTHLGSLLSLSALMTCWSNRSLRKDTTQRSYISFIIITSNPERFQIGTYSPRRGMIQLSPGRFMFILAAQLVTLSGRWRARQHQREQTALHSQAKSTSAFFAKQPLVKTSLVGCHLPLETRYTQQKPLGLPCVLWGLAAACVH